MAGIPRIIELIETEGSLVVIEEYISGVPLRKVLDEEGPLSQDDAVQLIRQLCGILGPLHQLTPPIVHRDIKPSNLLLTSAGTLYLVDFNSAKESSETKNQDTVLIGTAGYAAPEQYGFSASQPTADLYAMGVLLNEMLTGQLPRENLYEGKLTAVIQKCLQMDPSQRYPSVDDLLREIDNQTKKRFLNAVRPWLPPGLRSRKPYVVAGGLLWYVLAALLAGSMVLEDATQPELTVYRIGVFLVFLAETLWLGNYRRIWSVFPFSSSGNTFLKILGIAGWAVVLFFAILLPLAILC